ncbi:MAG: hypothetical protein JWR61_1254 [Ferruginibacter sp.]|nr:hypothetical protein [Ferruginibacter sp.]
MSDYSTRFKTCNNFSSITYQVAENLLRGKRKDNDSDFA